MSCCIFGWEEYGTQQAGRIGAIEPGVSDFLIHEISEGLKTNIWANVRDLRFVMALIGFGHIARLLER